MENSVPNTIIFQPNKEVQKKFFFFRRELKNITDKQLLWHFFLLIPLTDGWSWLYPPSMTNTVHIISNVCMYFVTSLETSWTSQTPPLKKRVFLLFFPSFSYRTTFTCFIEKCLCIIFTDPCVTRLYFYKENPLQKVETKLIRYITQGGPSLITWPLWPRQLRFTACSHLERIYTELSGVKSPWIWVKSLKIS